jgi:hypothetical protein
VNLPVVSEDLINSVDEICHRWRPLSSHKIKPNAVVDLRYDWNTSNSSFEQSPDWYLQFENDTIYVTTARFALRGGSERVDESKQFKIEYYPKEIYRVPEYADLDEMPGDWLTPPYRSWSVDEERYTHEYRQCSDFDFLRQKFPIFANLTKQVGGRGPAVLRRNLREREVDCVYWYEDEPEEYPGSLYRGWYWRRGSEIFSSYLVGYAYTLNG